jgi:hypothetical protein
MRFDGSVEQRQKTLNFLLAKRFENKNTMFIDISLLIINIREDFQIIRRYALSDFQHNQLIVNDLA